MSAAPRPARPAPRRRRRLRSAVVPALLVVAVLAAALLGACDEDTSVDPAELEGLDPAALVAEAARATAGQERFRFVLDHQGGTTEIVRGIGMDRAEGAVDGPARMEAQIEGSVFNQRFEFGIVILEEEAWIQNPLTRRWEREDLSLASLFDPRSGVIAAVEGATEPRLTGTERIDGVETYRVEALAGTETLAFFSPEVEPGATLPAAVWIGVADSLVRRLEVRGPIGPGEDDGIVRRLDLRDYGADVDIRPPR